MVRSSRIASVVPLVLAWGISVSSAAVPAPAASAPGRLYLATLIDTNHALPHATSVPVRVRLQRLTGDDRVGDLLRVARHDGELALRRELSTEWVGRLEIDGHLGDPIAYARSFEDADGEHLMVIAQRSLSRRELFGNRPSADYPFTVVELVLHPDGSGSGDLYGAARLHPRRDGEIELDGLNRLPARLMAVRAAG